MDNNNIKWNDMKWRQWHHEPAKSDNEQFDSLKTKERWRGGAVEHILTLAHMHKHVLESCNVCASFV